MSKIIHLMPRPKLYELKPNFVKRSPRCPEKKIIQLQKLCKKASKYELTDEEMDICLTAEQYTIYSTEGIVDTYIRCLEVIIKRRKFKWLKG